MPYCTPLSCHRSYVRRETVKGLVGVGSEWAMHLAFLASLGILLLSPVHANYSHGDFQK